MARIDGGPIRDRGLGNRRGGDLGAVVWDAVVSPTGDAAATTVMGVTGTGGAPTEMGGASERSSRITASGRMMVAALPPTCIVPPLLETQEVVRSAGGGAGGDTCRRQRGEEARRLRLRREEARCERIASSDAPPFPAARGAGTSEVGAMCSCSLLPGDARLVFEVMSPRGLACGSEKHFGWDMIMPNLKPPVTPTARALEYREVILKDCRLGAA
ncbi:hypothetical protein ACP70R_001397 [Stipagrostis hirtigluma subsp. patula]